jgi:5-formyltetrahydrofolate cyclo-ligase
MDRDSARALVWDRLRGIALPDSRFHLDLSMFIPDYPGSDQIPAALADLPFYGGTGPVFATPDNNLQSLRASLLREGRPLLTTTYGISRGFVYFPPGSVLGPSVEFASSLDGAERFGTHIGIASLRSLGRLDFLVTGASAVSMDGIRFGKGHGYFDLEWAMLRHLQMVGEDTPVVACVHDVQCIEQDLSALPNDSSVDWIITPSRTVKVSRRQLKPVGINWDQLDPALIENIPPLRELRHDPYEEHGVIRATQVP